MRPALLAVLALALLLTPAAAAQQTMPPRNSVWNVLTTVDMDVRDNYAIVKVIADITNRGPDPEFPFLVTIPDDAFVTGLTIERDGKVYEATIEAREQARQQYEQWKQQGQTGGLVEKTRHATSYKYLINVAEFTNVRASLTYERYLAADRGVYALAVEAPVSGFGHDLGAVFHARVSNGAACAHAASSSADACGADGVTAVWSTSNANALKQADGSYALDWSVGTRPNDAATPFELSYTLPPTGDAGTLTTARWNGTDFFVHRFRAPSDPTHMPVDLVLVLDISGSMSGLKFQQMQDAAKQVVQQLRAEDRLHLAFFSNDANAPWDGLRSMDAAGRKAAATEIDDALIAGGTNLESAIRHGFGAMSGVDWKSEEGRLPVLLVLTDGEATVGNTDRAQLRQLARDANAHEVNVFAIAFGQDADWSFIHGLAADGNGIALRVPEGAGAEVDLGRFMTMITAPVLKNVKIQYNDDAVAYRATAPVLFAGSELVVVGTYDASKGPLRATVTARAPDGARTYDVTATSNGSGGHVPRLVAYQEIRRYQELIDTEGERADWVDALTTLALKHGFVTDYTSLVVTLEARPTAASPTPAPAPACANCSMSTWAVDSSGSSRSSVQGTSIAPAADTTAPYAMRSTAGPAAATTSATATPTRAQAHQASGSPTGAPAKVPAPSIALVLAAVGAIAIAARRAKGARK